MSSGTIGLLGLQMDDRADPLLGGLIVVAFMELKQLLSFDHHGTWVSCELPISSTWKAAEGSCNLFLGAQPQNE